MNHSVADVIRCPKCRGMLELGPDEARCTECASRYPGQIGGSPPIDLRLTEPVTVDLEITVGGSLEDHPLADVPAFAPNPSPSIDLSDLADEGHTTTDIVSWIPEPSTPGAIALDLGSGAGDSRGALDRAGYEYVGLDHGNTAATMLGDAHRLPFADGSLDLVMSIAVLEHLHTPFLATSEVARVLSSGRYFFGTVAFLEPFHSQSYYHHSHLGVLHSLRTGGLEVEALWSAPRWTVLDAQGKVLFKGAPTPLKRALIASTKLLHRAWWAAGRRRHPEAFTEQVRLASTAAAWVFLARKP